MLKINNPVVETLQAARNLIADPEKWCQRQIQSADMQRVCAYGAIAVAGGNLAEDQGEYDFLDQAAEQLFPECVGSDEMPAPWVNDNLGHAAVLRMFDRAIELAAMEQAT